MDKAAAIKKIRQQLTEGDIEAALQLLIEHLEPSRKSQRDLTNRALQAKAQLEKTQRDELQGTVSFENSKLSYNQITQQIIRLVDEWEDPSLAPPPELPAPRKQFTPKMMLVAAVLLAFSGIIIWQLIPRGTGTDTGGAVVHAEDSCPEFEDGTFSIMILPYRDLRNPEATDSPHNSLAIRLDKFKEEFSGQVKTMVFSKEKPKPNTESEAIRAAEECRAQLAIWGQYDHLAPAEAGTIINTDYKYLSASDNFQFTMLNLDENSEVVEQMESSSIPTQGFFVDTVRSYAEIINNAKLSEELENQFRLLFGVATMQSGGNTEDAISLLENSPTRDSSSVLLREMALAEGYRQQGNDQEAVEAYNRVLETHPDYWFAVNNRAMIYYEKGEYDRTLEALDKKLENDPDNLNALTIRGSVRIKTNQLKEAGEDLEKAEKLSREKNNENPDQQRYIRKKIDQLEERKANENKRITTAQNSLSANPNNLEALTELAEANRNLGNYSRAKNLADRILDIQANHPKGIAIKLESAEKTNNQGEVRELARSLQELDTSSQNRIIKERPVIRTILRRPIIQ